MKILAIRLENLASLAGRHELDFTQAPLAEQGLFAITGPTGAGKSTLLDALCLALYGSTPRLRLAPSRESQLPDAGGDSLTTADARTLLRRGCAAGFAEVDFVGRDRRRYRARWAVRRARDRLDGRLQAAEQSLTDLEEQRLLTAQKREFERLLPERLGLSFEQFTRAVLLAQSEFAAFLKADDNARSDLLEKLTDTEVYSRISIAAYRRSKEALQIVRELEQRLSGELPADVEERARLESEAAGAERDLARLQSQSTQLQDERQWLEQEHKLARAADEAQRRCDQARREDGALTPLRHQADRLERVAPHRHRFQRHAALERQCHDAERKLALTRQALDEAEERYLCAVQERQRADDAVTVASHEREHALPLIETARELASRLDHLESTRHDKTATRERTSASLAEDRRQHETLTAAGERQRRELLSLETALREQTGEHADPLSARRSLQAQEDHTAQRRLALQALQQHWQQWQGNANHLNDLQHQQQLDRDEQAIVLERGQAAAAELERLHLEQQQLRASIERLRAARSESVAQLRQQLLPEAPCPVCGSLEHPYREAPPAEPAQAMLEATEREERHQLDNIATAVETARERHHALQGQYRALQARLVQNHPRIEQLEKEEFAQRAQLLAHPEGQVLLAQGEDAPKWLEAQLEEAEHEWQACRKALEAFEATQQRIAPLRQALQERDVELSRLTSRCEQHAHQLDALDAEIAPLDEQCAELRHELSQLLDKHENPSAWQSAIDAALENTRQRAQQSQGLEQQAATERQSQHQALAYQQQSREAILQEQAEISETLTAWRRDNPDIDDASLDALLAVDDQQRQAQHQRLQNAERERHAAEVSLQERRHALAEQRRERFADIAQDELLDAAVQQRIAELSERLDDAQATLTERLRMAQHERDSAQHALHDDDHRRERQRSLNQELDQARQEHHRWGSISELIGSADGKAFRRIAQAYNLEQLLDHANTHLATLSRRYRLIRGGSELGILVVDGDMADERRSVHSLSGGETFLVSLALALGLASMASGQLRIESLFIDEGFGSLDPQSLAVAMEALDGLQAQGRRVGVISHVQEMHERIPLQIRIEPQGNGASRLNIARTLLR